MKVSHRQWGKEEILNFDPHLIHSWILIQKPTDHIIPCQKKKKPTTKYKLLSMVFEACGNMDPAIVTILPSSWAYCISAKYWLVTVSWMFPLFPWDVVLEKHCSNFAPCCSFYTLNTAHLSTETVSSLWALFTRLHTSPCPAQSRESDTQYAQSQCLLKK